MKIKDELIEYSKKCINGKIISCKKHIWACEKFLKDINREDWDYYWDEKEAQKIVKWFTYLKHTKGSLAGQKITLTTWQKFVVCQIYGFRVKKTGYKRFKTAFIQVGRKNSKSQLQAGCLLYDMAVESTKNNEIYETYCAGTKREQSKIILMEASNMLKGSPLETKFKVNRGDISHRKTTSFLKPLSKDDGRKGDGTNIATLVVDEYHQHQTTEFVDLALGSNSKDSILIIITTAGVDLNSPCYTQEYKYSGELLDPNLKEVEDDRYFTDIHEAEERDDPGSLDTWKKANPLRATYPEGVEKIQIAYNIAKNIPEKMIAFKTKILDLWLSGKKTSYMPMDKWNKCQVKKIPYDLKGRKVYVGFDLSSKIDLTSVSFIIPIQESEEVIKYVLFCHSFIPSFEKLKEREFTDKVPYQSWLDRGFLTVTNSQVVDQNQIIDYIEKFIEDMELIPSKMCFDPSNASKMMLDMEFRGYECVEVYQSYKSLNEATTGFREEVFEENIIYEYNPILNFSIGNAVVRTNNGLIKIDKDATTKRVDPVDSTLGAYKLARYHEFEFDISKYTEDSSYLDKMYGGNDD